MSHPIIIREAIQNDMAKVHELICELAIYENAEKEVSNTVEQLIEDGFGDNKVFDCIVAQENETVVGFALYYTSYSTWKGASLYLEDFLVTESKRGLGIGKLLFNAVYDCAKQRKVKRFEWQVLDWNEPAINFYKKYETVFDKEWINCKIILD